MGLGMSDTATRSIQLDESWKAVLQSEFDQQYMLRLREFLLAEKQAGQTIYPPGSEIFAELDTTPFDVAAQRGAYRQGRASQFTSG